MRNKRAAEAARKIEQHLRHLPCLFQHIPHTILNGKCQAPAVILFVAVQLAEHIMGMLVADVIAHKAKAALIHMRVRPLRQADLVTLVNNILRLIEADMSVCIDVVSRVNAFTERLIAHILIQHLLRTDHKGLPAPAFAQAKGKGRDVVILYEVQRAPGSREAHMNHAVAQPVIVHTKFLCQLSSDSLQLEAHMLPDRLHARQFLRDTLSQKAFRHLKALAANMCLPLDPLDRAALILFQFNRLPPGQVANVCVVELLKLEKEPVLRIVEAFMEDGVPFLIMLSAVQNDGVLIHPHRNRLKFFLRIRCRQHLARAEKQYAGCFWPLVQRKAYDFQPHTFSKQARLKPLGIRQPLSYGIENDGFGFFLDILPLEHRNKVFIELDAGFVPWLPPNREFTIFYMETVLIVIKIKPCCRIVFLRNSFESAIRTVAEVDLHFYGQIRLYAAICNATEAHPRNGAINRPDICYIDIRIIRMCKRLTPFAWRGAVRQDELLLTVVDRP